MSDQQFRRWRTLLLLPFFVEMVATDWLRFMRGEFVYMFKRING